MNGRGHRAMGLGAYIVAAPFLPVHAPKELAAGAIVAVATSSGHMFSPDCDQGWLWRLVDRLLPDEKILDDNGPMQHRGITHWWLWPILIWVASLIPWDVWVSVDGHALTISSGWLLASAAIGVGSHVVADGIVGAEGQGRQAGVPLVLWFGHVGVGAKCGGWTEKFLTRAAVPAALVAAVVMAGFSLPDAPSLAAVAAWRP